MFLSPDSDNEVPKPTLSVDSLSAIITTNLATNIDGNYDNTSAQGDSIEYLFTIPSNATFNDEEFELDSENTVYTFPTLFDAIKAAEGVTLYSDLSNIKVTRKVPEVDGGGLIQTKLNLESLLASGDLSNNIKRFAIILIQRYAR